jgi:hypothetical protein
MPGWSSMRLLSVITVISALLAVTFLSGCLDQLDKGPFTFSIYISNQDSEHMDPVHIQLFIDGEEVVDREFHNRIGEITDHNWTLFEFEMERGDHVILAKVPEIDLSLRENLEMREDSFALLQYHSEYSTRSGLEYEFLGSEAPAFM